MQVKQTINHFICDKSIKPIHMNKIDFKHQI